MPTIGPFLGHTQGTRIHGIQGSIHCIADIALGGAVDIVAIIKRGVDDVF